MVFVCGYYAHQPSINNVALRSPAGPSTIVAGWKDVWAASFGTSYDWRQWTFRGGLGISNTPTTNDSAVPSRVPGVPDSNKKWLAVGTTYKLANGLEVSGSYGHEFFDKARINQPTALPARSALNGRIKEHVDLVSIQFTYKW